MCNGFKQLSHNNITINFVGYPCRRQYGFDLSANRNINRSLGFNQDVKPPVQNPSNQVHRLRYVVQVSVGYGY